MTPEDAVLQAAKQLTAALKRNLKKYMDENEIDQLNKLDTIFNTTANEFQKREKKFIDEAEKPNTNSYITKSKPHNIQECALNQKV